jgi:hypothetical protein
VSFHTSWTSQGFSSTGLKIHFRDMPLFHQGQVIFRLIHQAKWHVSACWKLRACKKLKKPRHNIEGSGNFSPQNPMQKFKHLLNVHALATNNSFELFPLASPQEMSFNWKPNRHIHECSSNTPKAGTLAV